MTREKLVSVIFSSAIFFSSGFLPTFAASSDLLSINCPAAKNTPAAKDVQDNSASGSLLAQQIPPPEAGSIGEPADGKGEDALFDESQSQAFMLVMNGKYEEAKKLVNDELHKEKDKQKQASLYYLLSAIERMDEDFKGAAEHLKIVMENMPSGTSKEAVLRRCMILKRLGDAWWGQRKANEALADYSAALAACAALPPDDALTASVLESITGTYVFLKNYQEAENFGNKLLKITSERAASNKLEDYAALFWARLQMLTILRNEGKDKERDALSKVFVQDLDKILAWHAELEEEDRLPDLEQTKLQFEKDYINRYHPQTPGEYLWLAAEYKMRTLPLIHWPAKGQAPKAAILCVHGLGLENRSFTPFSRQMQERGFSVYALDVRGFGAWQTTQGQEDLHFEDTFKDIRAISEFIKRRENQLPTFLLGESMGGAIALRAAAQFPDIFAGVISSVPSAERFQDRHMSMSVAFHLLKGGANKPFRVGDMVTNQATSRETVSERWKRDYKAKMELSPKELVKFAVFMRSTKGECKNIKIPAFVIQGLKDRLVKPEGTFDMFEAIEHSDKNLLILGESEHLIFETDFQQKLLLDALGTWIEEHRVKQQDGQANTKTAS